MYADGKNEMSDDSAPRTMRNFVGQHGMKRQVRIALRACKNDGCRFPHTLILGSPGLGKTALSTLIANELGADCKQALGNNFTKICHIQEFLIDANDGDILFIDEIHELKKDLTTTLYRAMENRMVFVKYDGDPTPCPVKLADFTLIGATTDSYRLPKPLRDRFKITLHFEFYSPGEITKIMRERAARERWIFDEQVFPMVASRSKGIPRDGLRLLESARRVSRANKSQTTSVKHLEEYCSIAKIDSLGLGPKETEYLTILPQYRDPVRLNIIGMRMGLLSRNISDTIEPFLFRSGLVTKNDKGRMLTQKGFTHIQNGSDGTGE